MCFRLGITLVHVNPLITGATVHATVAHQVVQRLILEQKEDGMEKEREIKINKQEAQSRDSAGGLILLYLPLAFNQITGVELKNQTRNTLIRKADFISWLEFGGEM